MHITLLIIAVAVALAVVIVKGHRRSVRRREEMMMRAGFQKVTAMPERLKQALIQLLRRRKERVKFGEVYRMDRSGYTLYRADIEVGDSDGGREWRFIIQSDRLQLPRLAVMPNVNLPKMLNKMWDALLAKLEKDAGLSRVQAALDNPFSKKYMLFVKPDQQASLPSPDTWNRYAGLPDYVSIEAQGGLIIFGRNPVAAELKRPAKMTGEQQLREAIDLATRLHDLFSRELVARS